MSTIASKNVNTWGNFALLPLESADVWCLQECRHTKSTMLGQGKLRRALNQELVWGTPRPQYIRKGKLGKPDAGKHGGVAMLASGKRPMQAQQAPCALGLHEADAAGRWVKTRIAMGPSKGLWIYDLFLDHVAALCSVHGVAG